MQKYSIQTTIILAIGVCGTLTSCSAGISSSDLNNHSLNNTYLDFAIVDQESSWPNLTSETYWANISLGSFTSYPGIISLGTPVELSSRESFRASINGGSLERLSSFLGLGRYSFDAGNNVTLPNNANSYAFQLQYKGNTYSGNIANFPYVYTINSATCQSSGGTINTCTVTTNKTQDLGAGANAFYGVLYGATNNNTSSCQATITSSVNGTDTLGLSGCSTALAPLQLSLQINYLPPISNMQATSHDLTIQMQAEYDFSSKSIPVTLN